MGRELELQVSTSGGSGSPSRVECCTTPSLKPSSFFSHTCHLDSPPTRNLVPKEPALAAVRVLLGPRGARATFQHLQAQIVPLEPLAAGPTSVRSLKDPVPSTGLAWGDAGQSLLSE